MKCFKYALSGLGHTIMAERNMRVHLCFAFYVICAGLICRLNTLEWAAVLICMGLVVAFECMNTALETLCDELHPQKSDGIRIVKDVSAGAVLCAVIAAAVVGGIVFFDGEKWSIALEFLRTQTVWTIVIIATLIPAVVFISLPLRGKRKNTHKE